MSLYRYMLVLLLSSMGLQISAQEIKARKPFSIGETLTFNSDILGEERKLNIYLPQGYDQNTDKSYPVIYLLDGSVDEDFIHIAGLVQFGSFSWINMLPESILVGIANVDRKRDFTYPSNVEQDNKDLPTSGGSKQFINFLENELQPLVNRTYRTQGPSTLIGQSLGGLLATEVLMKKPDLFEHYVIVGPSLWWGAESLLAYSPNPNGTNKSIFIAVGKEGQVMERTARQLEKKLKAAHPYNKRIFFSFLEAQDHGDALHLAVYQAFEKLFGTEDK